MKKAKRIVKVVFDVFVWIFLVFSVLMTVLAFAAQSNESGAPSLGGKYVLTVASDSMKPTFRTGDLLIADALTDEERQNLRPKSADYEGDVVTYKTTINGQEALNTHRIVATTSSGGFLQYITQGDNTETNKTPDSPIYPDQIVCVWRGTNLGQIGAALDFIQQPKGFLIVIVLPLVVFFLYEVYKFIVALIAVKNSGKKQISAADEELIKQKAVEEYLRQQAAMQAAQAAPAAEPAAAPAPEPVQEQTAEPAAEPAAEPVAEDAPQEAAQEAPAQETEAPQGDSEGKTE